MLSHAAEAVHHGRSIWPAAKEFHVICQHNQKLKITGSNPRVKVKGRQCERYENKENETERRKNLEKVKESRLCTSMSGKGR